MSPGHVFWSASSSSSARDEGIEQHINAADDDWGEASYEAAPNLPPTNHGIFNGLIRSPDNNEDPDYAAITDDAPRITPLTDVNIRQTVHHIGGAGDPHPEEQPRANSILSHRGYEKAEASTCSVVGRVVLASLCSLKIVYRWCVVSEDKEQETLTLYNMDTNLNAADAFLSDRMASDSEARLLTRCGNEEVPLVTHSTITDCSGTALSSRKHGTRGSTAEVTVENLGINPSLYTLSNHATACDSHYYRDHERNKNERSTTYDPNHDFTGAEGEGWG